MLSNSDSSNNDETSNEDSNGNEASKNNNECDEGDEAPNEDSDGNKVSDNDNECDETDDPNTNASTTNNENCNYNASNPIVEQPPCDDPNQARQQRPLPTAANRQTHNSELTTAEQSSTDSDDNPPVCPCRETKRQRDMRRDRER